MDGLKEWVRDLVVLVLLASCLEMLLPLGGMKKYVKLTMGLMIVLATLKPVFGFLGQPVAVTTALFDDKPQAGLPTISAIMARAAEFRQRNQALAAGEVKHGLAAEAARAARSVAGVADAEADVDLVETGGEVTIKAVTVRVTPGAAGGVKPVQPVEPAGAGRPKPPAGRTPTAEEQKLTAAVRQEVAQRLGLEGAAAAQVRVSIEQSQGR